MNALAKHSQNTGRAMGYSFAMSDEQPHNPLHGITLKQVVTELVDHYGWVELSDIIRINSFTYDPSIKSSLKFLRKTPWAREKVEALYISTFAE